MKVKIKNYHSALIDEKEDIGIAQSSIYSAELTAFVFDVNSGLIPSFFKESDVVYIEPAWRSGYNKFLKRAGIENTEHLEYSQYILNITTIINELEKPAFMIGGKHMIPYLKKSGLDYKTKEGVDLHGYKSLLFTFNFDKEHLINTESNTSVINSISEMYETVLDFCCGYGYTSRFFKKSILTDINLNCIKYIINNHKNNDNE